MPKVIIDFLFSQGDKLLKDPVPFMVTIVIGFALSRVVNSGSQNERNETKEERLKLKDEQLKQRDDRIQFLEKQIKERDTNIQILEEKISASQGESKQNFNTLSLNENEIRALKAISKFESVHSFQPTEVPAEYSVENLAADLQINEGDADEILKNLRMLRLFESIWDNVQTFINLDRPINETRPGRLSTTGQDFIRNLQSED